MFDSNQTPIISMIFKISRKAFTTLFSELEKVQIHPGQLPILMLLQKQDNLTQIEIANKVCVKASTIAVVLKKLEANGFIEKKIDVNDRRVFYICLTEKGKEVANKTANILIELENKITSSLSKEEKANLIICLQKVTEKFDDIRLRR